MRLESGFLTNTAGEVEREARSRAFNAIEGIGVMTLLLIVLWYVQYPFGVLGDMEWVNGAVGAFFVVCSCYLLFVSPFIHRDTLEQWGLGSPRRLYGLIRDSMGARRWTIVASVALVTAGLASAFYINWVDAADFLFDMDEERAAALKAEGGGKAIIMMMGVALACLFSTCLIRYDNFLPAFKTAMIVILILGIPYYLLAFLVMGWNAFSDFKPGEFSLDVFGYIFWGALQQLLFCSYFGTRLRKGFGPASSAAMQPYKRAGVAVLNGAFFGIIHINSWLLVAVTFILGVILSWNFMEDKKRNLIALGCIHGFLGSTTGWLWSSNKAGGFEIEMGVGPTHMDGFDALTMTVVTLLIIGFAATMVWVYRQGRRQMAVV